MPVWSMKLSSAELRSPAWTFTSAAKPGAVASAATALPRSAVFQNVVFIFPPFMRLPCRALPGNHDGIGLRFGAHTQHAMHGAREKCEVVGWERADDFELGDLRIGDHDLRAVVAVEFGRRFGQ